MPGVGDLLGALGGGSTVGRAVVDIVGDSSKLKQEFTEAQATSAQSTSKMGKLWQNFGFVAQAAMVVAAAAAVKFAVDSVKAFEEAEQANIKLQNSLINNQRAAAIGIQAYRDQATELMQLTGVEDEQVLASQAMLAQFNLTGKQIKELTPLIVDLSSKMGIDLEAATKAVGRGASGSTAALSRYGIKIDEAAAESDAFGAVVDGLRSKVGGFAEQEAVTLSGRLRILSANFGELKESAGSVIVPVLIPLVSGLNAVTESVAGAEGGFSRFLGTLARTSPFGPMLIASDLLSASSERQAAVLDFTIDKLGLYATQLQNGHISIDQFKKKVDELTTAAEKQGLSEETLAQIQAGSKQTIETYTKGVLGVKDAHAAAAKEARDQYLAELALAGGFVGIQASAFAARDATNDYHAAQDKLTRLIANGRKGTDAYREAVRAKKEAEAAAITTQFALSAAIEKYKGELEPGEQEQINELISDFGKKADVTKDDVNNLIDRVQKLVETNDRVKPVDVKFRTEGLAEARAAIDGFIGALNNVPGTVSPRFRKPLPQWKQPTATISQGGPVPSGTPSPGPSGENNPVPTREPRTTISIDSRDIKYAEGRREVLLGGG